RKFLRRGYPSAGLFHRPLGRIQHGPDGTVDHAAADLDQTAADDGRLNLDVEVDVLAAGDRLERALERVEILVVELLGHRDVRGDLAFVAGGERAEGADHLARREQAAVGG